MHLELSHDEARALRNALKIYLNETSEEASHTDDRHYRAAIRADLDRVRGVAQRINQLLSPQEESKSAA